MESTLFEASRDRCDQSGVFVVYIPPLGVPVVDHIDRILSRLHAQIADRKCLYADYETFVSRLALNHYTKFKAKIITEHPHVSLRSSGEFSPHVSRCQRKLVFSEVEQWNPGSTPTLCELTQHFKLASLSTVTHTPGHPPPVNTPMFEPFEVPPANLAVLGY